jgi:acyl-CoA hydrolase
MNNLDQKSADIKVVSASHVVMTELVLPNDTNQLGYLLGGRLMHWIDIAAALSAMRHSGRVCVTAAVDNMSFHAPIKLGAIVTLSASVNRVFRTSMEVGVRVDVERPQDGTSFHANTAYLTFVGVDDANNPVPLDEQRRFEAAGVRRDNRIDERKRLASMARSLTEES